MTRLLLPVVCVLLGACDSSPIGRFEGTTEIDVFNGTSDEHGYMETRADTVVISEASGGKLAIDWMGCRFLAHDNGSDSTELEPGFCEVALADGRIAELTVGWPKNFRGLGTTVAVLYSDELLIIDVVARIVIDGHVYAPSYFTFDER